MDKDLASAIMLERCSCYDRSLEAAKRVLAKNEPASDDAFWARKIVKSLGEEFLKQRFMDRAMECYQLLTEAAFPQEECPGKEEMEAFHNLGPNSMDLKTSVSQDVFELFQTVNQSRCNASKSESELLREAVYLLILEHASDKDVREKLFKKLEKVIRKD
ncbi:hypothetical protein [Desulfospira joergensenii]|uniref:hypothetical protein n=1 Tax=Desulfospira joergensenii TaxID=53329 RepID=UPI0003B36243|nr:hypothetical protein [Desulfospira joergensenii]